MQAGPQRDTPAPQDRPLPVSLVIEGSKGCQLGSNRPFPEPGSFNNLPFYPFVDQETSRNATKFSHGPATQTGCEA